VKVMAESGGSLETPHNQCPAAAHAGQGLVQHGSEGSARLVEVNDQIELLG
jgi:hypothetical protein